MRVSQRMGIMKRLKWILLAVAGVVVIVIGAVAILIYSRLHSKVKELEPIDGALAFISDRDGTWDVFIREQDGALRNITAEGEGDDYLLSFTFGGDMVYFYTNRSGDFTPARVKVDGTGLEVMNFMQAGLKAMTSGHVDADPRWAPDGKQLAWVKMRGFGNDVCVASVGDVNNYRCLTSGQGGNTMVAWSPDGTKLAFVSDRKSKTQSVYLADVGSGEQTQVTHDEGWDFQPVWSLDGGQILYISNRDDDSLVKGQLDLYLVRPDGSDQHRLAAGEVFTGDPIYSPSGKQVAYMSNESGKWQIYVMNADGSDVREVTDGSANSLYPVWMPKPAEEQG